MIRPHLRALGVAAAILISTAASEATQALGGRGMALSLALTFAFVLATASDILLARRLRIPGLRRVLPDRLAVGVGTEIEVTLDNPHGFALQLEYTESLGPRGRAAMEMHELPHKVRVPPCHSVRFTYRLRPLQRGTLSLGDCGLYVTGPLGLWEVRRRVPLPQRARVGADISALEQLARQAAVSSGESETTSLMAPRELLVWLDTGPMMQSGPAGGRTLDYATDATLALGFAAQARGTPMGVHLNAGVGVRRLVASAGARQLPELYRLLDGLQPGPQPVDFSTEVAGLLARPAGSTLIILMTRLPTDSVALAHSLSELGRRHRLLVIDIIDALPTRTQWHPLRSEADARAYCRAMHVAGAHQQAAWQLTKHGLEVLQIPGNTLAMNAVNRFTTARSQNRCG